MLHGLKVRVESFDQWILRVKDGLEATGDDRLGKRLKVFLFGTDRRCCYERSAKRGAKFFLTF